MNEISTFLQERIDANDFPSAVYLVAEKGEIVMHEALGYAVVEPERIEARVDTIYDLASLTKVLSTGLLTAKLVDNHQVLLSERISKYLPDLDCEATRSLTIRNLITHTSGLAGWKPLYILTDFSMHREVLYPLIIDECLDPVCNAGVVYSDLGYVLLGDLIETFFDAPLNAITRGEISTPLGLTRTSFSPHESVRRETAASEMGNEFEKQTCLNLGYAIERDFYPWTYFRDYQIWGEVHDGNAYNLDGVAGHAGLFSTAEEVFKIAQQFLPRYTTLLKPETCELFRTNFTPGMNEHRSFAFQLATTAESAAGTRMSPESFGHLGFTGTSVWIDPVKDRVFILLTNRTHNHPLPFVILNSVRRKFHDLAIEMLERDS